MARLKTYTFDEAFALMIDSEGRNSPVTGAAGHAMAQHVGGTSAQTSGRLMNSVTSSANAPIIMMPSGVIADKATTIDVYKSTGMSGTQAKKAFASMFHEGKANAGAFLDQQQAAHALKFALNSTAGQNALAALDGPENRQFFVVSMTGLTIAGRIDARKMYCASRGGGGADTSDIPHLEEFTQVTVGLDKMSPDGVHLQTFYPMA